MKPIELPAGTTHVLFDEVAHLIADALWPDGGPDDDRMGYGCARVKLDAELAKAVEMGDLDVKDPLTLGPHTFLKGNALKQALVSVDDLRAFVQPRGLKVVIAAPGIPAGGAKAAGSVPAVDANPAHWKMRVQAAAAEHWRTLRAAGANPTVNSIVDQMARWCRENDVRTDLKVNPSPGYLRTHVLGGGHWTPPD